MSKNSGWQNHDKIPDLSIYRQGEISHFNVCIFDCKTSNDPFQVTYITIQVYHGIRNLTQKNTKKIQKYIALITELTIGDL